MIGRLIVSKELFCRNRRFCISVNSLELQLECFSKKLPNVIKGFEFTQEISQRSGCRLDPESKIYLCRSPDPKFQRVMDGKYIRWPSTEEVRLRMGINRLRDGDDDDHLMLTGYFYDYNLLNFDLPSSLKCLKPYFSEVMLWGSGDELKITANHYDSKITFWNIFHGTKEVYLLSPQHNDLAKPKWVESKRYNHRTFQDDLMLEKEKLWNFSEVSLKDLYDSGETRVLKKIVDAGNCLYVPKYWWHEVYNTPGDEGFNLSCTWQFDISDEKEKVLI